METIFKIIGTSIVVILLIYIVAMIILGIRYRFGNTEKRKNKKRDQDE